MSDGDRAELLFLLACLVLATALLCAGFGAVIGAIVALVLLVATWVYRWRNDGD